MAFPTIQTADTKNGTVTSNSNSWTLTYPTNLVSGELILAYVATDGTTTTTWPAGWVKADRNNSAVSLNVAKKLSNGTETGTFSLGLSANEQGGWRIFRITGWEGTIGTTMVTDTTDGSVYYAESDVGASQNPSSSAASVPWGVADTLWIQSCGVDTSRTISVYPQPDNQSADVSGGSNGATLGLCTLSSAVSQFPVPSSFTVSASDEWVTTLVAIRPAADIPRVPFSRPMPPLLAQ